MEDACQDAPREAGALLRDGIPTRASSGAEGVTAEAPLEVVAALSFLTRLARGDPRRLRMPNRLLLSSYVPPQEWVPLSVDTMALGLEGAQEIIDRWSPFNRRESSVAHMHDLYPTFLWVSVAAYAEHYSIPFPDYIDRETFRCMAEDGMLIRNHNFHQSVELVSFDF